MKQCRLETFSEFTPQVSLVFRFSNPFLIILTAARKPLSFLGLKVSVSLLQSRDVGALKIARSPSRHSCLLYLGPNRHRPLGKNVEFSRDRDLSSGFGGGCPSRPGSCSIFLPRALVVKASFYLSKRRVRALISQLPVAVQMKVIVTDHNPSFPSSSSFPFDVVICSPHSRAKNVRRLRE